MGISQGITPPFPSTGFPYFFPTLFGSGKDGALTATNQTDVGYKVFGAKQYSNLTIPAGVTWAVNHGTSSGALMLAVAGTLTLAGTVTANGQNGAVGLVGGSGAGGDAAGGGTGGASKAVNGAGNNGVSPTRFGHGLACLQTATVQGRGACSGSFESNNAASVGPTGSGRFPVLPIAVGTGVGDGLQNRLIWPGTLVRENPIFMPSSIIGTPSTSGTVGSSLPSTNNYGPWAQVAGTGWLSLDYIPPAPAGVGGGAVTGVAGQVAAGGGDGGGGGVIIIECANLVLTAGYALQATGGSGGNGFSQNGTTAIAGGGDAGSGGIVIILYRTITGSTAAMSVAAGSPGTGAGTGAASGLAGVAGGLYLIQV